MSGAGTFELAKQLGVTLVVWLIFAVAAWLEVYGDASIRRGFGPLNWSLIGTGCLMLAAYGLAVNTVNLLLRKATASDRWSLSEQLGIYVVFFVWLSYYWSLRHDEHPHPTTFWGMVIITLGGLVIQFGKYFFPQAR